MSHRYHLVSVRGNHRSIIRDSDNLEHLEREKTRLERIPMSQRADVNSYVIEDTRTGNPVGREVLRE